MDKNIAVPRTLLSMLPARLRPHAATYAAGDVGVMFFLLRMAFWLSIVLILLPSGTTQQAQPVSNVGAADAISAASATVQDLRGFCARQPDACSVGSQVAVSLGYKAQAGAKMLYEFLNEAMASRDTASRDAASLAGSSAQHGSSMVKNVLDKSAPEKSSQSTLTPADLAPAWHGPPVRRDAKRAI
jgi:Family of unknown function (DUF5330)